MQYFTFLSRSRFALVALLAAFVCVATVGCGAALRRAECAGVFVQCKDFVAVAAQKSDQLGPAAASPEGLAKMAAIYGELRDCVRSIDASKCPPEFKKAFDEFAAYTARLGDAGEEIADAYQKVMAGDAEAAKTAQTKAQEFISLGQEIDARLKTLQEAAKKGK